MPATKKARATKPTGACTQCHGRIKPGTGGGGLCMSCWGRARRCSVPGCGNRLRKQGRCRAHLNAADKPVTPRRGMPSGELEMLIAILTGTADLHGALCATLPPSMFDSDAALEDQTLAAKTCLECPARERCARWAADSDDQLVSGVLGGQLHPHRSDSVKARQLLDA